jgi:CBS domain-containing protein
MKQNEPASKIMTRDPVTVHEAQKLSDVRKAFDEHGVHHIPVVSGKKLIGLISATDLLRVAYGDPQKIDPRALDVGLDTVSIRDAMVEDVATVQHDEPIKNVAEILGTGRFHSLPVLDGEDLVGVVTSTDLIRFLRGLY